MRIPIKHIKEFAKQHNLKKCIIFANDGKLDHIATWGENLEDCSQAADFGNLLKDVLKWPETLHAQPSRVKKLEKRIQELEDRIAGAIV